MKISTKISVTKPLKPFVMPFVKPVWVVYFIFIYDWASFDIDFYYIFTFDKCTIRKGNLQKPVLHEDIIFLGAD